MIRGREFVNKVFVVEASGEKKRVLEEIIRNESGHTATYAKLATFLNKGFEGYLVVPSAVLSNAEKVSRCKQQCEEFNLKPVRTTFVESCLNKDTTRVERHFAINWKDFEGGNIVVPQTPIKKSPSKKDSVVVGGVRLSHNPYTDKEKSKFPPHIGCLLSIYGTGNEDMIDTPVLLTGLGDVDTPKRPAIEDDELDPPNTKRIKVDHSISPSLSPSSSPSPSPPPAQSTTVKSTTSPSKKSPRKKKAIVQSTPRRSARIGCHVSFPTSSTTKQKIEESEEESEEEVEEKEIVEEKKVVKTPAKKTKTEPKTPAKKVTQEEKENNNVKTSTKTPAKTPAKKTEKQTKEVKTPAKTKKTTEKETNEVKQTTTKTTEKDLKTPTKPITTKNTKTPAKQITAEKDKEEEEEKEKEKEKEKEGGKKITKRDKKINEELDALAVKDPFRYIIQSLAHDAGKLVEIAGRESEFSQLLSFCKDCLTNGKSGSAYLCGKPGTGKTLTVSTTVNAVKAWAKKLKPQVITINCTQVQDPKEIFKTILVNSQTFFKGDSTANAQRQVEEFICSDDDDTPFTMLVLDEIDQLLNSKASVLYSLFEWVSLPNSKLILIGIANAIDLVQRSLPILSTRNIQPTIIPYKPYTDAQLFNVINARVAKAKIFDESAIKFCAKKVSSIDGDVRKALNICTDAANMKMMKVKGVPGVHKIGIPEMLEAINKNYPTETSSLIKGLTLQSQVVLCAAILLPLAFTRDDLLRSYNNVCKRARVAVVPKTDFADIVNNLAGYNLLDITVRQKEETISVPVTKQDLIDSISDSSLDSIKKILLEYCPPER